VPFVECADNDFSPFLHIDRVWGEGNRGKDVLAISEPPPHTFRHAFILVHQRFPKLLPLRHFLNTLRPGPQTPVELKQDQ